jgi:hypothetical protein
MSSFSKASPKPTYKKHYPFEVAASTNDAKLIAEAQNKNHKYQYMAEVTVVGDATIRPYDPVYLDNLPNGLSGYWTVISVVHRFGGKPGYYMLDLVVGTDKVGETSTLAPKAVAYRDVEGELNDQSITIGGSSLEEFSLSPNESDLPEPVSNLTEPKVTPRANTFPNPTNNPYSLGSPNFSQVKRTVTWKAKKGAKVIQ